MLTKALLTELIRGVCPDIVFTENEILIDQIDSLDLVLIVDEIENEFDLKFQSEDIDKENFETVDSLLNLLIRYSHDL